MEEPKTDLEICISVPQPWLKPGFGNRLFCVFVQDLEFIANSRGFRFRNAI